jgi:hypothetical protein
MRALLCAVAAAFTLIAATPAPHATPYRVDLTKIQSKALLPKVPLHTEFVVAVNKMGQVTRIISGKPSKDKTYNLQTAGNALQAFIRTPDGKAISGSYLLTYDYSPQTTRIHRDVSLVKEGGVDPNAQGAALRMIDDVRKHAKPHPGETAPPALAKPRTGEAPPQTLAKPEPGSSMQHLPDLQQILKTPAP